MNITLPDNYRALKAHDLVREGDQFVSPLTGDIHTVGAGDPAIGFPSVHPEQVRRRFHNQNNSATHRLLNVGEVRQDGDEVLIHGEWVPVGGRHGAGLIPGLWVHFDTVRRPLSHPVFRVLNNCRIAPGDERLVDRQWEPVPDSLYGSPADQHGDTIRRPFIAAWRRLTQEDRLQEGDRKIDPGTHKTYIVPADQACIGEVPHPQIHWMRRFADVEPGEGYRLLHTGEELQSGDESYSAFGGWKPIICAGFIGSSAGNLLHRPFRRRLTNAVPAVEPGEGYRLLQAGEVIAKDDEYWNPNEWAWRNAPFCCVSNAVKDTHDDTVERPYRRRVVTATPVLSEEDERFFRLLGPSEIRQEGDEFLASSGRWKPCRFCLGDRMSQSNRPVRRSIGLENIGPDHRLLKAGEVIQDGDEYWSAQHRCWQEQRYSTGEPVEDSPEDLVQEPWRQSLAAEKPVPLSIEPGEGYRLLQAGEVIQEGDEDWSAERQRWDNAEPFIGDEVQDSLDDTVEQPFRRLIAAEQLGEGYRLLKAGEIVQQGDTFWCPERKRWVGTTCGTTVTNTLDELVLRPWRRLIAADNLGPDHRLLKAGEIVQKGDEFWCDEKHQWIGKYTHIHAGSRTVGSDRDDTVIRPWRRRVTPAVPLGYRRLELGEIIEENDRVLEGAALQADHNNAGIPVYIQAFYRRIADVKPPEGFRLLHPGEVVAEGDAFWHADDHWELQDVRECLVGDEVSKDAEDLTKHPFIRAIDAAVLRLFSQYKFDRIAGVDTTPGATATAPATHYRELGPGDTLQKGDQVQNPGSNWRDVRLSIGEPAAAGCSGWGCNVKFRRPALTTTTYYRDLGPSDVLQVGDECISASGIWSPVQYSVGMTVDAAKARNGRLTAFRRPVHVAAGEGYRLLGDDETVRDGDEFFNRTSSRWHQVCDSVGQIVKERLAKRGYIIAFRRALGVPDALLESLADIMEPDSIGEWLKTPNWGFHGASPMQVIERGDVARIWRMIYLIGSGQPE